MLEIHDPRFGPAGRLLRPSTGEKRAMEHGQLHFPGVIGNGDREDAGILVIDVDGKSMPWYGANVASPRRFQ